MTTTGDALTQPNTNFPYVGATLAHDFDTPEGIITITVQRSQFTYQLTVYRGTYRVDDLCSAYATEFEALTAAGIISAAYQIPKA
jgi:hypothetical protein